MKFVRSRTFALALVACSAACSSSEEAGERASVGRVGARLAAAPGVDAEHPVRLFSYLVSSGDLRYAASVFQPRTETTKTVGLRDCAEADVRRMFSWMTSPIERGARVAFDAEIGCPSRIPTDARVVVEPDGRGASYLETRSPAPAPDVPTGTYFKMPNRCAGLLDALDIGGRAAALPPGSTGAPPSDDAVAIELACGDEIDAPVGDVWEIGRARFAERWWVYAKSAGSSLLVGRLDHEEISALAIARAQAVVKARLASALGSRAIFRDGYRMLTPVFADPTKVLGLGAAASIPLLNLCTASDCRAFVPRHEWVNGNDAPTCATAGRAGAAAPLECDATAKLSASLELRSDGRQACVAQIAVPSLKKTATVELPSCAESEPWASLLGAVTNAALAPWFTEPSRRDPETGDLADLLARGASPAGVAVLPSLDSHAPCLVEITDKELSSVSLADLTESCEDRSLVEITLPAFATLSGDPLRIDAASLAPGATVRVVGPASGDPAKIAVREPRCALEAGAACRSVVPAIAIAGDVRVEIRRVALAAAETEKPLTQAPALARVAVEITGASDARPRVTLRDVTIGAPHTLPFYAGVTAAKADVMLVGTDVAAYRRAVVVSEGSLGVVGGLRPAVLRGAAREVDSAAMTDMNGASLGGSVANFPVVTAASKVAMFVANARIEGPLGIAWKGDRASSAAPEGLFWATEHAGNVPLGDVSGLSTMVMMQGSGRLELVQPKVHHQAKVLRCDVGRASVAPRVTLTQQRMKCIAHPLQSTVDASGHPIKRPAEIGTCDLDVTPLWTVAPAATWTDEACRIP